MLKKIVQAMLVSGLLTLPAMAGQVVVAPNLMVVVGTSNSMNQNFDGSLPVLPNGVNLFNDASVYSNSSPAGSTWLSGNAYANAPTSKLYVAKQTLAQLLNSTASSSVNLGFATYKMLYGILAYSAPNGWNNVGAFNVLPSDPNEWNKSTTQQANDALNLANFAAVLTTNWIFTNNGALDSSASRFANNSACQNLALNKTLPAAHTLYGGSSIIGNDFCDGGVGVINDSSAHYMQSVYNGNTGNGWDNSSSGGLPLILQSEATNTSGGPIQNGQSSWYNIQSNANQNGQNAQTVTCSSSNPNCYQSQFRLSVNLGNPAQTENGLPYAILPEIPLKYYLCSNSAYYNADSASFGVTYTSDGWVMSPYHSSGVQLKQVPSSDGVLMVGGSYPSSSLIGVPCGNSQTAQLMPARTVEAPDGSTVNLPAGDYAQWTNPQTITGGSNWKNVGGQFISPQNVAGRQAFVVAAGAYSNLYAPNYGNTYGSGSFKGQAFEVGNEDGWSGETQYHCVYNANASNNQAGQPAQNQCASLASATPLNNNVSEQLTVNYPSGVSNPDADWRKLVSTDTVAEGSPDVYPNLPKPQHMGAFVDLPNPTSGYTDDRSTIAGLLGTTEMRDDGFDYNPNTQTMLPVVAGTTLAKNDSPNYGINADSMGAGVTNALYDTIYDAYGYYASYEAQDPYNECRNNNLLLMVDGKETARSWYDNNGVIHYADPTLIAGKIYNDLGVHVYVVMMSNLSTDVTQAQAIAKAGGGQAFTATDANSLLNSLTVVFAGLSGTVNAAPVATPLQLAANGVVYSEINTPAPIEGDVQAFAVDSYGNPSSTATWTAENLETQNSRSNALYTTQAPSNSGAPGALELFSNMVSNGDTAVFNSDTPAPADIIGYTINPSYPNGAGIYLAGRASGSWIGEINNQQSAVMLNPPSNLALLGDSTYVTYTQNEASRPAQLLFSSQDGFLYSIYQNGVKLNGTDVSGQLAWGFMPRDFLPQLKSYTTFYSQQYGNGWFTVADSKSGGAWTSYVVGTMANGEVNFALSLDKNGKPVSATYDDYRSAGGRNNAGTPIIAMDSGSNAYAVYLVNATSSAPNQAGAPTLVVRKISDGTEPVTETSLSFTPSSNMYLQGGTLYIGDNAGNVWQSTLLDGNGNITQPSFSKVGNIGDSGAVNYVGGLSANGVSQMFASSATRVTVFQTQLVNSTSTWEPDWTSYVGGAGSWSGTLPNQTYTASTTGAFQPGVAVPATGIQFLPGNSTITGSPTIVNNSLLVPVSISSGKNACASSTASIYMFNMNSGNFPAGVFNSIPTTTTTSSKPITSNIMIGSGTAYSVNTSLTGSLMNVYSTASQNQTQAGTVSSGAASSVSMSTASPVNKLVWWQLITN